MHVMPPGRLAGMPSNGEASSGYLVQHDQTSIMLDAGPGTAVALSRHLRAGNLAAVFITHQHTDHIFDLLPLGKMVLADRLARDERTGELSVIESTPRVALFVPAGTRAILHRLAALFPVATHPLLDRSFDLAFDVHEYEPGGSASVGGLSLRWELLQHIAPNCGIRLESDQESLVYTGDTGVTDALVALAEGTGTLLSESTLRETDVSAHGHLSSADAGRAASDAGVAELVLTHFASTEATDHEWHRERAAHEFDGDVSIAHPDRCILVSSPRKAFA